MSNLTLNNSNEFKFDKKIVTANFHTVIVILKVLALLVSLLNVYILSKLLKEKLYRFLFVVAIADLLYYSLPFLFMICLSDNQSQCGASFYYIYLLLFILISEYATTCLAFFSILIEIFMCV
jgi:hypothetical protein